MQGAPRKGLRCQKKSVPEKKKEEGGDEKAHLRDRLAMSRTRLLQWKYAQMRLELAFDSQQNAAHADIDAVWSELRKLRATAEELDARLQRVRRHAASAAVLQGQVDALSELKDNYGITMGRDYGDFVRNMEEAIHCVPVEGSPGELKNLPELGAFQMSMRSQAERAQDSSRLLQEISKKTISKKELHGIAMAMEDLLAALQARASDAIDRKMTDDQERSRGTVGSILTVLQ